MSFSSFLAQPISQHELNSLYSTRIVGTTTPFKMKVRWKLQQTIHGATQVTRGYHVRVVHTFFLTQNLAHRPCSLLRTSVSCFAQQFPRIVLVPYRFFYAEINVGHTLPPVRIGAWPKISGTPYTRLGARIKLSGTPCLT